MLAMIHCLVPLHGRLKLNSPLPSSLPPNRGSAGPTEKSWSESTCFAQAPKPSGGCSGFGDISPANNISDSESDLDQSPWSQATHFASTGLRFCFLFPSRHHQHSGKKRPGFGFKLWSHRRLPNTSVAYLSSPRAESKPHSRKLLLVLSPRSYTTTTSHRLLLLPSLERPDFHILLFITAVLLLIPETTFYFCAFDQFLLTLPDSLSSGITFSCKPFLNCIEKRYAQDLVRILLVASDRNANQTG